MSEILSRTWSAIKGTGAGPGWSVPTPSSRHDLPSGLATWLEKASASTTRREEEDICRKQLEAIASRLDKPGVTPAVMADGMVRAMYCHLVGYNASSIGIHAIKLAQTGTLLHRKMGYLACSILLPSDSQLLLLVTNTIVKDLSSTNLLDIQLGLVAASSLITSPHLQPMLLPRLIQLTDHASILVRKKALIVLHRFCDLNPSLFPQICPCVISHLGDPDPSVVSTSVQILSRSLPGNSPSCRAVVASLVQVMLQVQAGKLPAEYTYHGVAAPWLQMDIFRLFRNLNSCIDGDSELSAAVKVVIEKCLDSCVGKEVVSQALVYECIISLSQLNCCQDLLHRGLQHVSRFLQSKHNNIKYTGLAALEMVFKNKPPTLSKEQVGSVLVCLDHPDVAIQRKAVELLVVLANAGNVKNIVDTIIRFVKKEANKEAFNTREIIDKVVKLVSEHEESLDWYTSCLLRLVQVSSGAQRETIIEKLKFLLCDPLPRHLDRDPATELERNRVKLKLKTVLSNLVENGVKGGSAPPTVVALWVWCEGRFCGIEEAEGQGGEFNDVIEKIVEAGKDMIAKKEEDCFLVVKECILAVRTIATRNAGLTQLGKEFLEQCLLYDEVVESASEVLRLSNRVKVKNPLVMDRASLDLTLSFLDGFVLKSLEKGDRPYVPYNARTFNQMERKSQKSEKPLNFTPYNQLQTLKINSESGKSRSISSSSAKARGFSCGSDSTEFQPSEGPKKPKLWSLEGRVGEDQVKVRTVEKTGDKLLENVRLQADVPVSLEAVLSEEWS